MRRKIKHKREEAMISFGKYFDAQRDRLREMLKNKNTQLNNEWRERYDERENKVERKKKMGVKDNFIYEECMKELDATFKKELDECSEKGVEISQECKTYFKKKFEPCRMFNPIDDNFDGWWKR